MHIAPKVFVVQNHLRYDTSQGELVPKYDISAAERFGEFVFVLPPRATLNDLPEVIARLDEVLSDFTDKDYLLLIGNPCLIGFATALAAKHNSGRVRMLQWRNDRKSYELVEAELPV